MGLDYSFDQRIAQQYNQQRAHPPAVSAQIGDALQQRLNGGKLLEIGVGTGRIGIPAAVAGCRVTGVDLSREMLAEAESAAETAGCASLTLYQADMHHLPFADNVFDALLAVHVFHLAKDVNQVVREAVRVLKPHGLFLQGQDWRAPDSVISQFRNQLRMFVIKHNPDLKPPAASADVGAILQALGSGETVTKTAAEWTTHAVPNTVLASIANRTHAESWVLPDNLLQLAVDELTDWATQTWPDLNAELPVLQRFEISVTQGTW